MASGSKKEEGKGQFVPYDLDFIPLGYEAVYTGERSKERIEPTALNTTIRFTDETGYVIHKWSTWTWTWPKKREEWGKEIQYINKMQEKLGPLSEEVRRIRVHIGSLVPCDSGFPVTADELLEAIGQGFLEEPHFHNGCWNPKMIGEEKYTQPMQKESMGVINDILVSYLNGNSKEDLTEKYHWAKRFIHRVFNWLGSKDELDELQRLLLQWVLDLTSFWKEHSFSMACDAEELAYIEKMNRDFFYGGGRGERLYKKVVELSGLSQEEFKPENFSKISNSRIRKLVEIFWKMDPRFQLSDCHHDLFRYIERWLHAIGTLEWDIPTRKSGTERERLAQLLFGYVLGLDRWLQGIPVQFLMLDLGHVIGDLVFDPKNEILRVYAYLGEERNAIKEWLVACLWYQLAINDLSRNPRSWNAGLIRHQEILQRAKRLGINPYEWIDSILERASNTR